MVCVYIHIYTYVYWLLCSCSLCLSRLLSFFLSFFIILILLGFESPLTPKKNKSLKTSEFVFDFSDWLICFVFLQMRTPPRKETT